MVEGLVAVDSEALLAVLETGPAPAGAGEEKEAPMARATVVVAMARAAESVGATVESAVRAST